MKKKKKQLKINYSFDEVIKISVKKPKNKSNKKSN